jgi:Uma2 family endonuclease
MLGSMALPRKKPASYEDLLAAPDHLVAELIDGDLYTSPRPATPHARAATNLTIELGGPFGSGKDGGPGGWVILIEPELHLVGQVMVPDLAGWRRWLVDPTPKTLELFHLDGEGWRLSATHEGEAVVRAAPFEAIALDLAGLWAR